MKTYTTASCFAAYLLPYILFLPDFQERRQMTKICCLAWNIGLFPDAQQREQYINIEPLLLYQTIGLETLLPFANITGSGN